MNGIVMLPVMIGCYKKGLQKTMKRWNYPKQLLQTNCRYNLVELTLYNIFLPNRFNKCDYCTQKFMGCPFFL